MHNTFSCSCTAFPLDFISTPFTLKNLAAPNSNPPPLCERCIYSNTISCEENRRNYQQLFHIYSNAGGKSVDISAYSQGNYVITT